MRKILLNVYLTQHAQSHVNGGQQGPKRRGYIRVKCRSCEAKNKQGPVLSQVHTLTHMQRENKQYSPSFLPDNTYININTKHK